MIHELLVRAKKSGLRFHYGKEGLSLRRLDNADSSVYEEIKAHKEEVKEHFRKSVDYLTNASNILYRLHCHLWNEKEGAHVWNDNFKRDTKTKPCTITREGSKKPISCFGWDYYSRSEDKWYQKEERLRDEGFISCAAGCDTTNIAGSDSLLRVRCYNCTTPAAERAVT